MSKPKRNEKYLKLDESGVWHLIFRVPSSASAEDFRNKALKSLMDLEIPPDALVKVLKTIKDLKI